MDPILPFHSYLRVTDGNLHTTGQFYWIICNSRHLVFLSEYGAKHFAADTGSACSTISHHTVTGGDNRNTKTTAYFRHITATYVQAQTWLANTCNFFDNWLAFKVLQLNS